MQIAFWGVRGSAPTPLSPGRLDRKITALLESVCRGDSVGDARRRLASVPFYRRSTFGGNTTSIEVVQGSTRVLLDLGTGARLLGRRLVQNTPQPLHVLITHLHWDHIQGLPFFEPAYRPEYTITFLSGIKGLSRLLAHQQRPPYFPVSLAGMPSRRRFRHLVPGRPARIGELTVHTLSLNHPGGCFGYRLESAEGAMVLMTDVELNRADRRSRQGYRRFVQGADYVVVDSQYDESDLAGKPDWGHSSIFQFVELFADLEIGHLCMFHYDPSYSDSQIHRLHRSAAAVARRRKASFELVATHEGMVLRTGN